MFVTGKISDRIKTISLLKSKLPSAMTKDFFECSRIRHEGRGATERMRGEGKDSFEQTLKSKNLKGKRIFLGLAIFCIKSDTLAHLKKKLRK